MASSPHPSPPLVEEREKKRGQCADAPKPIAKPTAGLPLPARVCILHVVPLSWNEIHHPTSTLADLYDPLTMPAPLLRAHQALDRAVDRCYRPEPFSSDRHRVEYLFALYEKITAPLVAAAKPKKKRR